MKRNFLILFAVFLLATNSVQATTEWNFEAEEPPTNENPEWNFEAEEPERNFGNGEAGTVEEPEQNFGVGEARTNEEPEQNFGAGEARTNEEPEQNFGNGEARTNEESEQNFGTGELRTNEEPERNFGNGEARTDGGAEESVLSAFPGYAFSDSIQSFSQTPFYRIPGARYQAFYGDGLLSKTLYELDFQPWSGVGYGMASSAGLFFQRQNGMPLESFHTGAARAWDLVPQDRNERLNLSLTDFIEMMEVSAKGPVVTKAALEHMNDLLGLAEATRTVLDPVVVCVYPGAISAGQGRVLLCWRAEDIAEGARRLYVYDPDFPAERGRSLFLLTNPDGQYTGWRYSEWGSEAGGGLTFVPYSVLRSAWLARGRPAREVVLLRANLTDATIYDSSENVVAVFRDGKAVQRTGDVRPFLPLGGVLPDGLTVWLPTNEVYSLVNDSQEPQQELLEARLVNIRQSVSVRTAAKSVSLSVEDETVSSFVQIPDAGFHYDVHMLSELDSEYPDIRLRGVTQEDESMTVLHYAGTLHILGIQKSGTLYINGSERSSDDYLIPLVNEDSAIKNFLDVSKEQYYYQPIQWALSADITDGTSPNTFSPDMTCSRAHILTFLWRANSCPEPSVSNPFSDVSTSIYYAKAAAWAYEMGIVSGPEFHGETPCRRSEAVVYLWKLAASPDAAPVSFRDVSPEAEYSTAVSWAVERGITKGVTPDSFSPDAICTRGHIITFLCRYFETDDESLLDSRNSPRQKS